MDAINLRAIDVGAVLREGSGLLARKAPIYFSIAIVPALFVCLIGLEILAFTTGISVPRAQVDPRVAWTSMNWLLKIITLLSFLVLQGLVFRSWAATVLATSELKLGRRISPMQAYVRVRRKSLRMLWITWTAGLFTGPLALVLGPIAAVVSTGAFPFAVIEGLGVRDSLRRSSALAEGNRLRVVLLSVLCPLLPILLIVAGIASPLPRLLRSFHSLPVWVILVGEIPVFFAFFLASEWAPIVMTLVYFKLLTDERATAHA